MNFPAPEKKLVENDVTEMRLQGQDLKHRWHSIFKEIVEKTGFSPDYDLLRQSQWWKTGKVGAVHCPGLLLKDGQEARAVLKIQGTKPATSEALMIEAFAKQNKSKIIRPPQVLAHIPWNQDKQYEALILERVDGKCAITSPPAPNDELDQFFNLYHEYKTNCCTKPWVEKPKSYSFRERVKNWRAAVEEQAQNDLLRKIEDEELTERAIQLLERSLAANDLEFVHGHFQPGDLIVTTNGEVVLFSNLFWSWRMPFYDAVFAYHWWMLGMEHVPSGLTRQALEQERRHWFDKIFSLPEVHVSSKTEHLVGLALLERAVPALMVDRFMLDPKKDSAKIITEGARQELRRLIDKLS